MDVVLVQTVPNLGQAGQTKRVAAGYARNYLLARGLACLPTDPRAKEARAQLRDLAASKERERASVVSKVGAWVGKTVQLAGKASADGTLYAAVTGRDVAKQLGIDVKRVDFDSVKSAGTYQATIDMGDGASATVTVVVQAQS